MGVSGLSCFCKNNTFSNGLSLSPCRVMDSGLEQQVSRAASTVVLRPRLPLYCRASQCHSLSGKQRFSHDARRPRQVAIVQAEAAHFASGLHRRWSISSSSSSSSTSEASREQSAVQFEICRIPGDGSCLFRALAQGVHQLETGKLLPERQLLRAGFQLRREVCKEMTHRREELEPFITGIFDAYVEAMALEGCWGGEPELAVAIHCLQRPVVVYKQVRKTLLGGQTLEKVAVYGAEEYPGKSPVCVLFSGAHYDTLLQVPAAR